MPPPVKGARWIPLNHGRFALVDERDYAAVRHFKWRVLQRGSQHLSVQTHANGHPVYLHRIVMARALGRSIPKGLQVDHRDGDGFDCRRSNLRLSTPSQNGFNQRLTKAKSGFRGVYWHRKAGMWRAMIRVQYKLILVGCFHDPVLAARARDDAARRIFGDFARLNFPGPGELPALSPREVAELRAVDQRREAA
jgi:HNH endonuclease